MVGLIESTKNSPSTGFYDVPNQNDCRAEALNNLTKKEVTQKTYFGGEFYLKIPLGVLETLRGPLVDIKNPSRSDLYNIEISTMAPFWL